ncbi:hypothetical protein Tco_0278096 [Tanacetum coccineum]
MKVILNIDVLDECWTGLHEMAMAAFESQYIVAFGRPQTKIISPPRNCMPPDVLLRESRQARGTESEKH